MDYLKILQFFSRDSTTKKFLSPFFTKILSTERRSTDIDLSGVELPKLSFFFSCSLFGQKNNLKKKRKKKTQQKQPLGCVCSHCLTNGSYGIHTLDRSPCNYVTNFCHVVAGD